MKKNSTYVYLPGQKYIVIQKEQLDEYLAQGYIQGTGISKEKYQERQKKQQETMLKKYGVRTPVELPHVKEARQSTEAKQKRSASIIHYFETNFGVQNNSQLADFKDKFHNTLIERYGSVEAAYQIRNENSIKSCNEKYGVDYVAQSQQAKEAYKLTCNNKYGVDNYTQSLEYQQKAHKKYRYNNINFDSSWELALWIYAEDHNEEIERCPCSFEYIVEEKVYKYFPDFNYKGKLVEIKGDQFFNENNELIDLYNEDQNKANAKYQCMIDNNVYIYTYSDIKFALDYINNKYGEKYLKQFKNK